MKVFDSIMDGLEEAVTLKQIQDLFRGVPLSRVRELATAEREERVVVLPVAEGELSDTPEGNATVENWDITARVKFCTPHHEGFYWSDRYSDFDILDIAAIFQDGSND